MWLTAALVCFATALPAAQAPAPAFAPGEVVATVSTEPAWGAPSRLAWAPDGRSLYLRFTKRDVWGNERNTHFLVILADPQLKSIDAEPDWALAYWAQKSALAAPGRPDFRIAIETREERRTATGVVSAGSMAQSGGDPSLGAVLGPQGQAIAQSTMQAQKVTTTTFKVKGELIAEFVNEPATPGLTYSWGPARLDALVVVGHNHRLMLIGADGQKRDLTAAADWRIPAWSPDGARLAALRFESKRKMSLHLLAVPH